jgi:hypothetical protein
VAVLDTIPSAYQAAPARRAARILRRQHPRNDLVRPLRHDCVHPQPGDGLEQDETRNEQDDGNIWVRLCVRRDHVKGKLESTIRCGGLHVRKTMIIMMVFEHRVGAGAARQMEPPTYVRIARRRGHAGASKLQVYGPEISFGRHGLVLEKEPIHGRHPRLSNNRSLGLAAQSVDARVDPITSRNHGSILIQV